MSQQLTIRGIIIGGILSVIMAMSAVYLSLRMNAFYWASVLTSLLSLTFLTAVGRIGRTPTNVHEVNLTQTMASAGGILAVGICFTFPALFFLDKKLFAELVQNPVTFSLHIFIVALTGGCLGVVLSAYLRKPMIEDENLPFPTGIAAADTIKTVIGGSKKGWYLLCAFLGAAFFTTLRDGFGATFKGIIPFYRGTIYNGFTFQFGFIPMTIGGGYLIGYRASITWLAGCLLSCWAYQPFLYNFFHVPLDRLQLNYVLPFGVGIVIGSGLFLFIKTILPTLSTTIRAMTSLKSEPKRDELSPRIIPIVCVLSIIILTTILKINLFASILAVVGLWIMTVLAARMTGETNIDPIEILAVIVVVGVNLLIRLSDYDNIILCGLIAVAVGVAADLLFDLKAGYLLGTSPLQLTKAQLIGVFSASFIVGISLVSLVRIYQLGSPELFALQSQIVAFMLSSINWSLFLGGIMLGIFMTLSGFSGLAFGVGFFIPMFFSIGFAIGGILKSTINKKYNHIDEEMRLIAAGLIGGEGVSGSLLAVIKMIFFI